MHQPMRSSNVIQLPIKSHHSPPILVPSGDGWFRFHEDIEVAIKAAQAGDITRAQARMIWFHDGLLESLEEITSKFTEVFSGLAEILWEGGAAHLRKDALL